MTDLDAFLAGACVDDAVAALRPDYRALVAHLRGLGSGVRVACRLIPATPTTTGTAAQEARP